MASAERKPIMGFGAEPELRGPGPPIPPPNLSTKHDKMRMRENSKKSKWFGMHTASG